MREENRTVDEILDSDDGFEPIPDSIFTPQVLANIDAGLAEIAKGNTLSWEQVKADLQEFRQAWLREQSDAE